MTASSKSVRLPVHVAAGSGSSDTEESRAFLQERLGLYGKWTFIFSGGFLLVGLVIGSVFDARGYWGYSPLGTQDLFHLLATVVPGSMWLLARTQTFSPRLLRMLDPFVIVSACVLFGLMGASITGEPIIAAFVTLLASTHMVVFRAIVVPSAAGRTAWIGAASFVPILAANAYQMRGGGYPSEVLVGFIVSNATWCVLAIAVAAVASSVIFGLRREVQHARRLGQYTLERKIGEGGMGAVYRARHVMLRRPTAIKLLPPDKAGEASIRRFEREVRMTAQLSHPNTVAIYDYGRTPDGVFYYAMEYLDGVDLQALVRLDGPQPPARVEHILEQACGALSEAHQVNLIHRDIKPANIILTVRGGEPDVVKVVDFGLVKQVDTHGTNMTVTSARNMLVGSPHYMAPEAITSPDAVDARTDLYALGAVAYFLLTGLPVFDGKTFVEICSQHLQSAPVRPSERGGRPVPDDLEAIVMSCLAKQPTDRPATAVRMLEQLRATSLSGVWTNGDAARWWSANQDWLSGSRAPAEDPHVASVVVELGDREAE